MARNITPGFGEKLKKLRIDNNYSLDSLCKLYNLKFQGTLNKGTLSKYENNLQEPRFTTASNLSEIFNVRLEYFSGKNDVK